MSAKTAQAAQTPTIRLDAPTRVYKPGDNITGFLELANNTKKLPTLVQQGIAKSKSVFPNRGTCRGRTLLVWQRIELQQSNEQQSADGSTNKTFRFSSLIPLECTEIPFFVPKPPMKGSDYWDYPWIWDWNAQFLSKDTASPPLPPTCKFGPAGQRTVSDCQVGYAIVALDLKLNGTSEVLASAPFWLMSLPAPLSHPVVGGDVAKYILQDGNRLLFSTEQLTPEGRPKLTAMQRLKSGSMSSAPPQVAFSVKVARPQVVQAGSSLDVWVELTPQDTDLVRFARASGKGKLPNVVPVHVPDVVLKAAKFELDQTTVVRTRGHVSDNDDAWEETVLTLKEPPVSNKKQEKNDSQDPPVIRWSAGDLAAYQPADGVVPTWIKHANPPTQSSAGDSNLNRKLTFQIPLPERLAPSFKSYNIARRYKWKLGLSFECAGEVHQVYYRFPNLTVLPPEIGDDKQADDALDFGEYKLETEKQTLAHWGIHLGLELGNLGLNIAQLVLSF